MKYIVIVSGGMDSITLLRHLQRQGHTIRAISFNYGQRHRKELQYAKRTCRQWRIPHQIVDLRTLAPLLSRSALTGRHKVPHGHYTAPSMKITVVPNRNMIMLSIAIGYAENLMYDYVAFANHAGDHAIYPDCRPAFVRALNRAASLGTYHNIQLAAPFMSLTKGEIAKKGLELGIDYAKQTWSCYEGKAEPCGKCGTCVERAEALQLAE